MLRSTKILSGNSEIKQFCNKKLIRTVDENFKFPSKILNIQKQNRFIKSLVLFDFKLIMYSTFLKYILLSSKEIKGIFKSKISLRA